MFRYLLGAAFLSLAALTPGVTMAATLSGDPAAITTDSTAVDTAAPAPELSTVISGLSASIAPTSYTYGGYYPPPPPPPPPSAVPIPGALLLMGSVLLGGVGLTSLRKRRRKPFNHNELASAVAA